MFGTESVVVRVDDIPDPHFKEAYAGQQQITHHLAPAHSREPSLEDRLYIIHLHAALLKHDKDAPPSHTYAGIPRGPTHALPMKPPSSIAYAAEANTKARYTPPSAGLQGTLRRFSLIKEVQPYNYYTLVGEVAKLFVDPPGMSGCVQLWLTDFTENPMVYDQPMEGVEDESEEDISHYMIKQPKVGAKIPSGHRTLEVFLWNPHSFWAAGNLKLGDMVILQNVHIKMSPRGILEGAIHSDHLYPDKISCSKVFAHLLEKDPTILAIRQRKATYLENSISKARDAIDQKQRLTKKEKRERKKQKRDEKRQQQQDTTVDGSMSESDSDQDRSRKVAAASVNKHTRCSHPDIPTTALDDLVNNAHHRYFAPGGQTMQLPFINARYRARVRVVDFWPKQLEDFARCFEMQDQDNDDDSDAMSIDDASSSQPKPKKWEWCFYILVQDATVTPSTDAVRVPLLVFGMDAVYLLKLDAVDLRQNTKRLEQLKEQMWTLWGNLEELQQSGFPLPPPVNPTTDKEKMLRNTPFECCIQEYGIEVATKERDRGVGSSRYGFQRMYRMCGITIMGS